MHVGRQKGQQGRRERGGEKKWERERDRDREVHVVWAKKGERKSNDILVLFKFLVKNLKNCCCR